MAQVSPDTAHMRPAGFIYTPKGLIGVKIVHASFQLVIAQSRAQSKCGVWMAIKSKMLGLKSALVKAF